MSNRLLQTASVVFCVRRSVAHLALASQFLALACGETSLPPSTAPETQGQSLITATISLTPKSIATRTTEPVQFTATVRDAAGEEIPAAIEWSASGGTVDNSGRFFADVEGQFQVNARLRNNPERVDSGTVTVSLASPPSEPDRPAEDPPAPHEPNRPEGFTTILDVAFDSKSIGWAVGSKWSDPAYLLEVQDSSAPRSGAGSLEFAFPAGFKDVSSPARAGKDFAGQREIYVAYWIKISHPWHYHSSGVNKLFFIGTNSNPGVGNEVVVSLRGTSESAAQIEVGVQNPANLGKGTRNGYYIASVNRPGFALGAWHRIEVHAIANTEAGANGSLRWWVDGVLVGDHKNVEFKRGGEARFNGLTLDPNWGGQGSPPKVQRDWIRLDHLTVAGR